MTSPAPDDSRHHGWRIGTIAGSPVYIARSWPVIAVLIIAVFGPALGRSDRSASYGYLVAAGYAGLLLGSVLVHEAAHALAARARGHSVGRIVADVWGGHTVYDATRSSPGTTAIVAVVGPLSNLALAVPAWAAGTTVTNETAATLLLIVARANLLVGLFNLLPGLPLDGGQIVSALVWRVTGRKGAGLVAAGWLGRAMAVATVLWFAGLPLLEGEGIALFQIVWPVAIAFFLWQGATQAIRAGAITDATSGPVESVLEPVLLLPASDSLADVHRRAAGAGAESTWLVATDDGGWPFGLFDPAAAGEVPPGAAATTPLGAVVTSQPADWVVSLAPDAVLTELVRAMSERNLPVAVVVDETTRRVRGLVTAERINTVVGSALARRRRA
ncbi:site-2 protease family protein [Intrasporangium calvum]|uniref:Peptidase M50 n=1 Tax=Intrasporangium calvum (strain ATCC 23552 / DSM 43043 / JCM 3097 / NBRC 12989 / NCIMB 10167 / NRRL B-3866 / 7 KIP) TaxID=710696 RepID=E6SA64_INTC7|nr:site-2 protease family protein [Intrasporangium calvum]ADU48274.1 peptidase M50 [Intrasporangium calvum DSM 43043]AXG13319.1 peptidase M50 [Intrasporangium calvum]